MKTFIIADHWSLDTPSAMQGRGLANNLRGFAEVHYIAEQFEHVKSLLVENIITYPIYGRLTEEVFNNLYNNIKPNEIKYIGSPPEFLMNYTMQVLQVPIVTPSLPEPKPEPVFFEPPKINIPETTLWEGVKEPLTILFDIRTMCPSRGIGDVLMTTPIIRALKQKFPNSEITYWAHKDNYEALIGNPYIDVLVCDNLPTYRNKYTHYLRLERKLEDYSIPRNLLHRLDSISAIFNVEVEDKSLILNLSQQEINFVKDYIMEPHKKQIGIAVKTSTPFRDWPQERFHQLAQELGQYYRVYILDKYYLTYFDTIEYNLTGRFTLRELCAFISHLDLVITLDSACLHIAAALGKKTIALFGAIPSELRAKYYKDCHVIQKIPCGESCYDLQKGNWVGRCSYFGPGLCLLNIQVEDVFQKVRELL